MKKTLKKQQQNNKKNKIITNNCIDIAQQQYVKLMESFEHLQNLHNILHQTS